MWCSCGVHVAEIDNIKQPVAKIWNRLVVLIQKVICKVICDEQFSNRWAALVKMTCIDTVTYTLQDDPHDVDVHM